MFNTSSVDKSYKEHITILAIVIKSKLKQIEKGKNKINQSKLITKHKGDDNNWKSRRKMSLGIGQPINRLKILNLTDTMTQ